MNQGSTIFSQLMEHASRFALDRCIRRYQGNYRVRSFSCRDQFLVMAFAQLTYRESLRDIEACLGAFFKRIKQHLRIKGLLRPQPERGEGADLDRNLGLRARRDRKEEIGAQAGPLHNPANPECPYLRQDRAATSTFGLRSHIWRTPYL